MVAFCGSTGNGSGGGLGGLGGFALKHIVANSKKVSDIGKENCDHGYDSRGHCARSAGLIVHRQDFHEIGDGQRNDRAENAKAVVGLVVKPNS
jgi:hypothetical protein